MPYIKDAIKSVASISRSSSPSPVESSSHFTWDQQESPKQSWGQLRRATRRPSRIGKKKVVKLENTTGTHPSSTQQSPVTSTSSWRLSDSTSDLGLQTNMSPRSSADSNRSTTPTLYDPTGILSERSDSLNSYYQPEESIQFANEKQRNYYERQISPPPCPQGPFRHPRCHLVVPPDAAERALIGSTSF